MPRTAADTVLLFGARSFLGGHVCRALLHRGYKVLLHSTSSAGFKNLHDLSDGADIEPVVCEFDKHDALRSLMARSQFIVSAAIPYSKQSIGQAGRMQQNMLQLQTLLDALSASAVRKSVFVSVSGTIGRVVDGVADETRHAGQDAPKGWGHLSQKIASETMIGHFARNGLRATIVNPSMCVGAYDTKPSTGEFFKFFAQSPFALMPDERLNIVDVEDVAAGTVLALEKGRVGERYILSGTNTTMGAFIRRIKQLEGKAMPRITLPRRTAVLAAYASEVVNLVVKRPAPVIPLLGIELIEQGSQHLTSAKAEKELGFRPRDAWPAVDRAHAWYKQNGIL